MAGAGNAGEQSVDQTERGVDVRTSGTERGRYNTEGLYTGPTLVGMGEKPIKPGEQEKGEEERFVGQARHDPDDESINFIGSRG